MRERTRFKTGLACTCTAAVCCLTPILVVALSAVGLSAAVGWLDYVLLPILAVSAGITIHAAIRLIGMKRRARTTLDADLS
jgi:mercuric ion transport protein